MSELLGVVTAEALITTLFHLLSFLSPNTPFMPSGDPTVSDLLLFPGKEGQPIKAVSEHCVSNKFGYTETEQQERNVVIFLY